MNITYLMIIFAPLGYFYSSYGVAALCAAILAPALIFIFQIAPVNAIIFSLAFGSLQACAQLYRRMLEGHEADLSDELKIEDGKKNKLAETVAELDKEERAMKEDELTISNLFEITKKMSENLKFNDIFNVFSAFLKSNFSFSKCDLLILNWEDARIPRLERVYSVWYDGGEDASRRITNYDRIIRSFLDDPKKIHASKSSGAEILEKIGIEDPAVTTFTAVPLLNDNRLVAILTVENLPTEQLEKFLILSMQFALEIKKVLLYETVEKLAITDSLTGLYLRRYFYDRFSEELQRSRRYGFEFAFLMIDIDDFKRTNDTYGHLVGDVILKELARIIKESVREIDLVSRYGGEEIAIVLTETGAEGAVAVAERIRKKIEERLFRAYDETLKITVSIGVSIYPKDSDEADSLIERADTALYDAKKLGKNVVCRFKR